MELMNRLILTLFLSSLVILNANLAFSRPPASIAIAYSQEESLLSIDVLHISRNVRDHYIRRCFLYKNDELVERFVFVRQQKPTGFSLEVSIDLEDGDEIRVKTICSEAGRKEEVLIVELEK